MTFFGGFQHAPLVCPFVNTLVLWCLGGTYMGQVSCGSDLYFPSFQCSSVFKPAEDVILGCFWNVF